MYSNFARVRANAFLNCNSGFSSALAQRLGVLTLLLVVALMTTSCGTVAQAAAGTSNNDNTHSLNVSGTFPAGTVSQPYTATLAVNGGSSPYHFSVKTGSIPPGISLNPATGTFSGKPTASGTFAFEVIATDAPHFDHGSQSFSMVVGGSSNGKITVSVSPASASLTSGQKQQFTATVSGTSNTGVTWTATSGSIDANGFFTAPTVTSQGSAVVTAKSDADSTKSGSATVTVNPVSGTGPQITTGGLPQGQKGSSYNETFAATGGTTPYKWSVSAGNTPPGITMNASGDFSGLPSTNGTFDFTVTVVDASNKTATGNFSVAIVSGGNYDGPAELPRATVPSAMSDTPAPGSVIPVAAGGDLQSALNNARCGDVVELQAGATFTGKFSVPAKGCDNNHWVFIRTSAPDSALPAEGQRATPCYAGVASLPGRPLYPCSSPKNVMAKVQNQEIGDGPFQIAPGANFYRFIGLEITRVDGIGGTGRLVAIHSSQGGTADHLVVDRSWLHGNLQDETVDGVELNGVTNGAVIDSYFSDFHCVSQTGTCTDAHAVSGGVSNSQDGPFKIQNNFLEAAGEAVLFGGGAANLAPADIQILNNHFWKPWQWMPGNKPFVGGKDGKPFVVKNHLELKNAVRVQVEANLMENNWGGFSQAGSAILLTPKNQHTQSGSNICPLCQVTDVTVRYVRISHAGGGMDLVTALGGNGKNGEAALAGERWSIHDMVLDDLSTKYVGGGHVFLIMNTWTKNPLNTVTINHVTGFPDPAGHMMVIGNIHKAAPMYGLVFTNNMIVTSPHPIWNSGGGQANCAFIDVPVTIISSCFNTFTFGNNALIATPPAFPPSTWPSPTKNLFPATTDEVQFVNYNNGNGGNYELQPSSPYKNKGTDGKDLGADVAGLDAALANVE
jgi:hypothetical protein